MKTCLLLLLLFTGMSASFAQKDTFFDKNGQVLQAIPADYLARRLENLPGLPVQNFTYTDAASGQPVNLNDASGKIRLLYFGDIWHDPCLADFAALHILTEKYQPDGLVTIALTGNKRSDFDGQLQPADFKFPILVEANASMLDPIMGGRAGYPRLIILGRTEVILAVLPPAVGKVPVEIAESWGKIVEPILFQN